MSDPLTPLGDDSSDPTAGAGHQGLPKATIMVSFVTILIAGAATFLAMQWSGSRATSQQLQKQLDELTAQENQVSQELGDLRGQYTGLENRASVLGTGTFVFCNNSDETVTIKHLASTWLDANGEFKTFSTEEYGKDLWVIRPNSRVTLDFGRGAIWDGSVTYYSLILERTNERRETEQIPFSGYWKAEQTECTQSWPAA